LTGREKGASGVSTPAASQGDDMDSGKPEPLGSGSSFIDVLYRLAYGSLPASGRVVATLLAALLLVWPICSFVAMFDDSPIQSSFDELHRALLVYSVWCYPLLYALGLGIARWVARYTKSTWKVLLPFAIPAFTPTLVFLTFSLHS
jgi:hypothetical protein